MITRSSERASPRLRHDPAALFQARMNAGLTQAQLATLAHVTQPYVSRLENGVDTPAEETLATLAAFCGVTADSLRAR